MIAIKKRIVADSISFRVALNFNQFLGVESAPTLFSVCPQLIQGNSFEVIQLILFQNFEQSNRFRREVRKK